MSSNFYASLRAFVCCIFAGLLWPMVAQAQNCTNDTIAPTVICPEFTVAAVGPNGQATVNAVTFNQGSYDDCCQTLTFSVRRQEDGPCDSDGLPDALAPSVTFCCAEVGIPILLVLRATDCSGNFNECMPTIEIVDKLKPVCTAPADVTVQCADFDPSLLAYGSAASTDNCCIDTTIVLKDYTLFDTVCNRGTISRIFRATDCSGLISQCTQHILVNYEQDYWVKFPDDVRLLHTGPSGYGEPTVFKKDCELIGLSFTDEIFTDLPDVALTIERTWTVINWCTYNTNLPLTVVPNPTPSAVPDDPANLIGPVVASAGSLPPWNATVVKIHPSDPQPTDYSIYWEMNTNGYRYTQYISILDTSLVTVQGKVFYDTLENCTYDLGEQGMSGWKVLINGVITGEEYEVFTDSNGIYKRIMFGSDTVVTVTLASPINLGSCSNTFTLNAIPGVTTIQDIAVQLQQECPVMTVDLSSPILRRCFSNNVYHVKACNLSGLLVQDARVEVTLDDFMDFGSSSIPATPLGNNVYAFDLDDLDPAECTTFSILFTLRCEAELGATHCSEAHVFPDTLCDWTGSSLRVSGNCDGDSVRFSLRNTGSAMMQGVEFVVVEDVIMRQSGNALLGQGETRNFSLPANGSTWRLQTSQVPGHPWGELVAAAVEGCGGLNTPGLVTQFALKSGNPFVSLDCQQNVGSYDPNDKSAVPQGYGNEHLIEANTGLDYLIRFQNTGTDTAFTVVVLDTLSEKLNPASVRPGAASHAYDFALLDDHVLRFTFSNILLPDSNINEAASHGFIKFRIEQQPDLPDGTRIENRAAIYFDFNDPVITNTTFHTIGDHFIVVSTDEAPDSGLLRAYPNPASDAVFFDLKKETDAGRFTLSNSLGQIVWAENFAGKQVRFDRKNLPAGIYHFQITSSSGRALIATGKVALR